MKFEAIDDFLARVRKLNKSNKDFRLSYEEANALAVSLAELLAQLNQKKPVGSEVMTPSVIDGGHFPKRN